MSERKSKGHSTTLKSKFWLNLFLVLVGVVLGTMLAHVTAGSAAFSWLAFGQTFGTPTAFNIELGILTLTLGIKCTITVSTILCIAISLLVGKYIFRK